MVNHQYSYRIRLQSLLAHSRGSVGEEEVSAATYRIPFHEERVFEVVTFLNVSGKSRKRPSGTHGATKETYTTAAQTLTATEQQAATKTQGYKLWLKLCSKCACDVV